LEATIQLEPDDKQLELFGMGDSYLRQLRMQFGVQITARAGRLVITGKQNNVEKTIEVLQKMQKQLEKKHHLTIEDITSFSEHQDTETSVDNPQAISVFSHHKVVAPSTKGQQKYVKTMLANDLTFCIGPAGTGKTYLAVAVAVSMLKKKEIRRIVLARPAVEAGEKLGFLPGDLQAKVNPYLRPLFDALEDMMDFALMKKFMSLDIIEIIPLAFMRGRTLNDAIIICDEAQNSTHLQMLMVLTRLGHGSKMIVTGDVTQIDLEPGQKSGMVEAVMTLCKIKGIGYVELSRTDIVRHKLVQKIVQAYDNKHKTD
jgi:phosphate starvation-inducible protein PhoH and related proteins